MATFAIRSIDAIVNLNIDPDVKLRKIQTCINLMQKLQRVVMSDMARGIIRDGYKEVADHLIRADQKAKRSQYRRLEAIARQLSEVTQDSNL